MRRNDSARARRVGLAALLASASVGLLAQPAFAQATTQEDQATSDSDELVVTAERRARSLQDVPISATVMNADQLAERGVDNVIDIQQVAPSIAINTFNRSTFINIRGVGIALSAPTSNPGIAYYIDGQLIPHEMFIGHTFYDLNSVEVLRGPQGTLTGQNSTGGAIYVTTPQPEFDGVFGTLEGTIAEYEAYRAAGAINIPFSDNVALRIAGVHDERDSFTTNIGPSGTQPGNYSMDSIRGNLAFRNSEETVQVNLRGEVFEYESDNNAVKNRADAVTADPFTIEEDARGFLNQEGYRASAELRLDLSDEVQFRAITSYQDAQVHDLTDGDRTATAAPRPPAGNVGRVTFARTEYETFMTELNLLSTGDGPVQWVVGGFYLEEDIFTANERDNFNTVNYVSPTSATIGYITNTSGSLFGQVDWQLTPRLQFTVGARHSWDEQTVNRTVTLPAVYVEDSVNSTAWTGRVGLNYDLTDNTMLYATLSRGYKAGGVNFLPGQPGFDPETNEVIEIGAKTQFWDRHLRLNAALFSSEYSDIQFNSLLNGVPLLENAAAGESWGGELELNGYFGNLEFNIGVGYLDASFSSDVCLNNTNNPAGTPIPCPTTTPGRADTLVSAGDRLPYSPEWTINAGVQYDFHLGQSLTLTPRLQWSHLSEQIATPFPDFRTIVPERDVVDARLSLDVGERYTVEAFAQNLLDETYIAAQIQTSSSADGGYIYGAPRQIGVRFTARFGE